MSDSLAISSHGIQVLMDGTAIPEVRNVTPPSLTRKSFDTSIQASDDDQSVMGILRKGSLTFDMGLVLASNYNTTATTSIVKAIRNRTKSIWKIVFPDGANWACSGSVENFAPKGPVEGDWMATVGVKLTGAMTFLDS